MQKIFNAKIDKLIEIKKQLDLANKLFLTNLIGKNELETVGNAVARHAKLSELEAIVEKYKPIKGTKVQEAQRRLFANATQNLMLAIKAYEAGITTVNSTFDAYVKMAFDFEAKDIEKAYASIRKRTYGKSTK